MTVADIRRQCRSELAQARDLFMKERHTVELTQSLERAGLRTDWKTRREQRAAAWRHRQKEDEGIARAAPDHKPLEESPDLKTAFTEAHAMDEVPRRERRTRSGQERPHRPRRPRGRDGGEDIGRERK